MTMNDVVGQRVVSDLSVIRSCCSICGLCSEFNNDNMLIRLLTAVNLEGLYCFILNIT